MNTHRLQRTVEATFVALGFLLAYLITQLPHFAAFKLLNLAGIFYDLIGVLVLSYVVTSSAKIRSFIAGWGSVIALGLSSWMVLGMMGGALAFSILGFPNLTELWSIAAPVFLFALISGVFIEDFALAPAFHRFKSVDARIAALGGYFVVAGLLLQLYAALLDFLA